jgi:NAD(P)H-dependent FMN reductase
VDNWAYPAVLKNALDYLDDEWIDKPTTVVSSGPEAATEE